MAEPRAADPTYQSLYRRFRPQRFDEVLGQEHVSLALRNAVRDERAGHAYLFSGPRGTGKTSTARILAKALNCADPQDGEPCGVCSSCVEIARGTSMDVHELDAASNNGVEAMRDLVAHSALGTPGRWKIYIVDEVHMLSTAASNALLKTLEEPPRHVVFVLATTDAQKVLPTIRSRTQHFEFRLLGPDVLSGLLRRIREEAELGVADDALDSAVRRGRGSARDALSALDQVAAGGAVRDEIATLAQMADALAERDANSLLVEVARAFEAGLDAARLASELTDYLRQGFLAVLSPELVSMTGEERERVDDTARRLGLPALVRAMEALGRALVDMRDSPDPRVHLEAMLIRLAHPEMDDSSAALLERVERLERAVPESGASPAPSSSPRSDQGVQRDASGSSPAPRTGRASGSGSGGSRGRAAGGPTGSGAGAVSSAVVSETVPGAPGDEAGPSSGPALARRALSELRPERGAAKSATAVTDAPDVSRTATFVPERPSEDRDSDVSTPVPTTSLNSSIPSRDELVQVWGDELLSKLPSRARVRFRVGRFVSTESGSAVFALPNETHRAYCEEVRSDVEVALAARFGATVPLSLVVDDDPMEDSATPRAPSSTAKRTAPAAATPAASRAEASTSASDLEAGEPEPDFLDPSVLETETEPAGAGPSPEERIKLAFPGAVEV